MKTLECFVTLGSMGWCAPGLLEQCRASQHGRNTAQEFGIPNVNLDENRTGLSFISVPGYPNIGDNNFNPAIIAMNNYQFSDNVDMTRGNHSFKMGFDIVRRQTNIFQAPSPKGRFSFSTIQKEMVKLIKF